MLAMCSGVNCSNHSLRAATTPLVTVIPGPFGTSEWTLFKSSGKMTNSGNINYLVDGHIWMASLLAQLPAVMMHSICKQPRLCSCSCSV